MIGRIEHLRVSLSWVVGLALLAACGGSPTAPPTSRTPAPPSLSDTVVIVSLDGFRHDYPRLDGTPSFGRMRQEGGHVERLVPCYPSQTFPAHATLATGVFADRHGIVNNRFLDRKRGVYGLNDDVSWYTRPPLWIHAQRQGVRSHVYHWIASHGAYEGTVPTFSRPYDRSIADSAKIDTALEWLAWPPEKRPGLAMIYLLGCDEAGHLHTPESDEVRACAQKMDHLVGRLLQGAQKAAQTARITVLVVSDHGMTTTRGHINAKRSYAQADPSARVITTGPVAHVYADRPESRAALVAHGRSLPHVTAYARKDLPDTWRYDHPDRTGDVVLIADFGYRFDDDVAHPNPDPADPHSAHFLPASGTGHHGHAPDETDMGAILHAWGAGIRPGASVPTAKSVDLVPTVCRILGIAPPAETDGQILGALLEIDDAPDAPEAPEAPETPAKDNP